MAAKSRKKFIRICNLGDYQHYHDRSMIWFKWHIDCINDYNFTKLADECRWLFIGLMCLACKNNNQIPFDSKWIARQISSRLDIEKDIKILSDSNLIEVCSGLAIEIREEKIREEKKGIVKGSSVPEVYLKPKDIKSKLREMNK